MDWKKRPSVMVGRAHHAQHLARRAGAQVRGLAAGQALARGAREQEEPRRRIPADVPEQAGQRDAHLAAAGAITRSRSSGAKRSVDQGLAGPGRRASQVPTQQALVERERVPVLEADRALQRGAVAEEPEVGRVVILVAVRPPPAKSSTPDVARRATAPARRPRRRPRSGTAPPRRRAGARSGSRQPRTRRPSRPAPRSGPRRDRSPAPPDAVDERLALAEPDVADLRRLRVGPREARRAPRGTRPASTAPPNCPPPRSAPRRPCRRAFSRKLASARVTRSTRSRVRKPTRSSGGSAPLARPGLQGVPGRRRRPPQRPSPGPPPRLADPDSDGVRAVPRKGAASPGRSTRIARACLRVNLPARPAAVAPAPRCGSARPCGRAAGPSPAISHGGSGTARASGRA